MIQKLAFWLLTILFQFTKWLLRNMGILSLRLLRWLCDEGIEEIQRHMRRPQVRRKPVQTQYQYRSKKPKEYAETGTLEWGADGIKDAKIDYYSSRSKSEIVTALKEGKI